MAQKTETAHVNVIMNGIQAAQSIKELEGLVRKYRAQWRTATIGTKEHIEATKALKAAQSRLAQYRAEIRATQTAWSRMSESFDKYKGIAIGVIAASTGVIAGIKSMTDEAREFEKTLTNVFTLLSQEDFDKFHDELERGSKEIMVEYGLAFEDVNKAMFDAISAGVPAGDAIAFLHKNARLALGGVTDLGTAVDGTTTIMNAFGRGVQEVDDITNAFFSAQKFGKTTVEQLSKEIGKVAPIANLAGLSYQETLSAVSALTLGGIRTAEATTYLKGALQAVVKPSKEAEEVLRAYGVPVGIAEVKSAGLGNVLNKLNEVILQNPDAIAKAIPAVEGLTGIAALSGKGLAKYGEILDQVNKDIGENSSLTEAFNRQMETGAQYTARAQQELALASITLGEKLQPVLGFLIFKLSNLLKIVSELPRFFRENQEVIILLIGAFLALNAAKIRSIALTVKEHLLLKEGFGLKAKDAVITQMQAVKTNFLAAAQAKAAAGGGRMTQMLQGTKAAVAGLVSPLGLVILGISGLVAAIKLYDKHNATSVRLDAEKKQAQESVAGATMELDKSYQLIHASMREFNRLSVEEKKNLRESLLLKLQEAETLLLLSQQKQKEIAADNTRVGMWDRMKNAVLAAGNPMRHMMLDVESAVNNGAKAGAEMNDEIINLQNTLDNFREEMKTIDQDLNAEAIADAIATDSISALNEKLSTYEKALNNAKIGSEDFIRIQKKIAIAQSQLKSKQVIIPDKEELEKLKRDYENFQKEILKINEDNALAGLPIREREIALATKHYDELLAKAVEYYDKGVLKSGEFESAKVELAQARKIKIDEINLKEYEEEAKLRQKRLEEEREKQNQAYEEMAELREEIFQLGLSERDRELRAIEEEYEEKIRRARELNLEYEALEEEKRKRLAEINEKYDDEEQEKVRAKQQQALELAELGWDTFEQIRDQRRDQEAQKAYADLEKRKEQELEAAGENADAREQIEQRYQQEVRAIRIAEFEREKRASIVSAIIKGALAALNAFVIAKDPATLAGLLIAAGASTAANIAVIAAQKPGFYSGGFTAPAASDHQVAGLVHANEYVVPAWQLRDPQAFSLVQALEAQRSGRGFVEGGFTTQTPSVGSFTSTDSGNLVIDQATIKLFTLAANKLADAVKNPLRAYVVIDNKAADEIKDLQNENQTASQVSTV